METVAKPKFEAIYPLTYMQQGLLFHHLSEVEDEGYLNVECTLKGRFNIDLFEAAWNKTIERHAVLRTTVHWTGIEKPVTVVHQQKKISINYLDWSNLSVDEQKLKWTDLKNKASQEGVDFQKAPLLNITIIGMGPEDNKLLWPNHHLLIDGWSSHVILDDFLSIYDALCKDQNILLKPLPSLKSYLNWRKKKDKTAASEFWNNYFEDFSEATEFANTIYSEKNDGLSTKNLVLSKQQTSGLQKLARENKVTLNTLVQGVWSFLISRYFNTDDITYGTTVSGRSGDFPNIGLLTGMFMNVQPVRNKIQVDSGFEEWLQNLQKREQEARQYEHINLDEIASFIDWPEAKPLFDSLLIFENFPQAKSEDRILQLEDFKSGITSTYALTMIVIPGDEMKFILSAKTGLIDADSAEWIFEHWKKLIETLTGTTVASFEQFKSAIPVFESRADSVGGLRDSSEKSTKYAAPRSQTELKLVKIWENLFGLHSIGINDNFFELGGKSLMAARMFKILNEEVQVQLPPTTLLEHPTIAAISELISSGANQNGSEFKNLVPIRAKGEKPALFCVHAGGGHVFFYNLLAKYLDKDRPIYALQPSGILGNDDMHSCIEEMAQAYAHEIQSAQSQGPYNLMVYCFSTAVGLEMSKILRENGSKTNLIVMDTMAEQRHLLTKSRMLMRVKGFLKRFVKNPSTVLKTMIQDRYIMYLKPIWINLIGSGEEKNTELMSQHLYKIYRKYKWRPQNEEVKLFLTEKADEGFNTEYIRSWKEIALEGVDVIETPGDHRTLFIEPDIAQVAETIDGRLL